QAEDVIRDFHVTGVQTCALPICGLRYSWYPRHAQYTEDDNGTVPANFVDRLQRAADHRGAAAPWSRRRAVVPVRWRYAVEPFRVERGREEPRPHHARDRCCVGDRHRWARSAGETLIGVGVRGAYVNFLVG